MQSIRPLPFVLGSEERFAAIRALFADVGYTEAGVVARCGIETIYQLTSTGRGRTTAQELGDALDLLIHLFVDGRRVEAERVHALLPAAGLEALREIGLVDRHPEEPGSYAASVFLYPTGSLYVASDLDDFAPGLWTQEELEDPEFVFSAINALTATFLTQLPATPCERFLELCAGTGIAALAAARSAGHAWALDIAERSTRFAEFNARLNGIGNLTALRGDVYEPVAGETFDRIVAHPPYVPAAETRMVFRDGGRDGEEVLRRVVAGVPDHLSPGGRFYCTCVSTDRRAAPLEQRIRAMLGERESEFDLLLVTQYELRPIEFCYNALEGHFTESVVERFELYRALEAERVVSLSMVLQRHARPRAAITLRRQRSEAAEAGDADRLLDWATRAAEEDSPAWILESRPALSAHARLHVVHRPGEDGWETSASRVEVAHPFRRSMDLSTNAATLLTLFDGAAPVHDVLERIRGAGAVPQEVTDAAFTEFVHGLVVEGVLVVEDPRAGERASPSSLARDLAAEARGPAARAL
jgi:methylase of polypeptide subunit release factors